MQMVPPYRQMEGQPMMHQQPPPPQYQQQYPQRIPTTISAKNIHNINHTCEYPEQMIPPQMYESTETRGAQLQSRQQQAVASAVFSNLISNPTNMINNIEKVSQVVQSVGPVVEQYGPIMRSLPSIVKILTSGKARKKIKRKM